MNVCRWFEPGPEAGSNVQTEAVPVQGADLHRSGETLSIRHTSPELLFLSYGLNVLLIEHFISSAFSSVADFQGHRCRKSQLGDKPGCATGLGNLHAPHRTRWPLRLVSSIIGYSRSRRSKQTDGIDKHLDPSVEMFHHYYRACPLFNSYIEEMTCARCLSLLFMPNAFEFIMLL